MPRAVTFAPPRSHANPYQPLKLSSRIIDPCTNTHPIPSPISKSLPEQTNKSTSAEVKLRFPSRPLAASLFESAPSLRPSIETLVCRCLPLPSESTSTSSSSSPTSHPHPHSFISDLSNSRSSNPSPLEIRRCEAAAERVRIEKASRKAAGLGLRGKAGGVKRAGSTVSSQRKVPAVVAPPSPVTRSRANSPVAELPSVMLPALGIARGGLKRTRSTQAISIPSDILTNPPTPILAPSPKVPNTRRAATLSPPAAPPTPRESTPATVPMRHAIPLNLAVSTDMQRANSMGTERVRRETTLPRNLREYETRVGAMS